MQVSHGAIQFMVYEELKRFMSRRQNSSEPRALTSFEISMVGAVSKLFATLTTYPFSVSSASSRTVEINVSSASLAMQGHKRMRFIVASFRVKHPLAFLFLKG